jgi:hypothetical protein
LVACCAYTSGNRKAGVKKILRRGSAGNWARHYPFGLDIVDQVWPENFGGLYKAPAVDLVSGVYMGVQGDDQ